MHDDTDYGVSFVSLPGMEAIEVIDPIERHRYRLETPHDVRPTPADTDAFLFPVDRAVEVETAAIGLPSVEAVYVRTRQGAMVAEAEHDADVSLSDGAYVLELCAPVKLYLEFEGAIDISSDRESMQFGFDGETTVSVGARSAHRRPEATIQTTTDPVDLMAAVTAFGSALKTTSPERTFPTLRGHPPRLEVGDRLAVPDELSPPQTGITITLEPTVEAVFTVSTLAYYLGATIEPGDRNALRVDGSVVQELGTGDHLADAVEEVLRHTFLLDCVVRTEGLYPVDLNERARVTERVAIDLEDLYHRPIGERLERHLSIQPSHLEDIRPRWGKTAHMVPDAHQAELLPFIVDDLALVQVHDPTTLTRPETPTDVVDTAPNEATAFTRSSGATAAASADFVRPPLTDCVDQVWVGDGTPIGASKAVPEAYEHRLERTPTDTDIDIAVVCNDSRMNDERGLIDEVYGSRDDIAFDVSIHHDLTKDGLAEVLHTGADFLHYIGHIDEDGVECTDGRLDVSELDSVDVPAFLLNACRSYRQGRHLIEQGGIGGIVTLSDVINEGAVRMGLTLAQLLNMGFPLYASLSIAEQESLMGSRYIVVGDGSVSLTQPRSVPNLAMLEEELTGTSLMLTTFPSARAELGGMVRPQISEDGQFYLVAQEITYDDPDKAVLDAFFERENLPVKVDGQLTWSNELVDT